MSARSVCSGTRPSRYHSVRLISAPPRRPEHWTLMPSAPARWAFCTARFIARRKAMRLASWSATPWATSAASSSGVLISTMLSWIFGLPVMFGDQRAQLVGLDATATDHDARAGGVDVDADLVARALDLDPADRRRLELLHDRLADLPVLGQVLLVLALAEPAALPVGDDAEAEPVGVDLLAHQLLLVIARLGGSTRASKPAASACSSVSNQTSALVTL